MFKSLYAKLSLTLVILLISAGVLYTLLTLSTVSYYLQETSQRLNADLAKNLVSDKQLVQAGKLDKKALSTTFMEYMVINPSIELYLLDSQGKILSFSAEPGKVKRKSVSLEPVKAFLNKTQFPILGDDPRSYDRQKIFSVTPVPGPENKQQYYLYVVLLGEQYDNVEQFIKESLMWKQTGFALVISLATSLIIGLFLFARLTKRLNKLSLNMDQFANSDFSQYQPLAISQKPTDEIEQLAGTFNHLADRLLEHVRERSRQNKLHRDLVANVSHDLRTPIAILHGYLETLDIKAGTLTQEEQKEYIHQALQSSKRLNALIVELFRLSKLDACEVDLQKDYFNLSELAHDIIQKFQLPAVKLNIQLEFHVDQQSLFIHGDIGLISRVLENLMDNALKFATSHIKVSLKNAEQMVVFLIEDDGKGILEEELNDVFERFYQGSNHHHSQSAGLGLAIAKRIVELHKGCIEVKSSSNGTCFKVSLPK